MDHFVSRASMRKRQKTIGETYLRTMLNDKKKLEDLYKRDLQ